MKKTYSFSQVFSTSNPRFDEVCQALVKCEREFDVEILVGIGKITHKKRENEYIGREVSANAEGIRSAMGKFCESQVKDSKFNFWRFTVELETEDVMSVTEKVKTLPHPAMYSED